MSLRDFLERFRPAGTPGASATGVPADRAAERAAELEPALARLARAQQEADRIRAEADEAARKIREDAAREAARLMAAAREQAPEVRRQAAHPSLDRARGEAQAVRAAGDSAAAAVRARAAERMPGLVERAVADAVRLPARGSEGRGGPHQPNGLDERGEPGPSESVPHEPGAPRASDRPERRVRLHESLEPGEPGGPVGPDGTGGLGGLGGPGGSS
ncbi:hypothetical protein [Streptomyces bungoensis]|uniref:hypothetical protein n=1 Tax=Streptomyces bungoensis TaxID=285568 RepID=UPI003424293E